MKTIEQFYNEVKNDNDLQAAFAEAVKNNTVETFLKEQQVDGTPKDLEAFGKAKVAMRELSDEELEQTAGGDSSSAMPEPMFPAGTIFRQPLSQAELRVTSVIYKGSCTPASPDGYDYAVRYSFVVTLRYTTQELMRLAEIPGMEIIYP